MLMLLHWEKLGGESYLWGSQDVVSAACVEDPSQAMVLSRC